MKKQIPNLFTLGNLFFGCIAIVYIMQSGLTLSVDASGENLVEIPERIYMASIFIGIAAVIDFFDCFVWKKHSLFSMLPISVKKSFFFKHAVK